MLGWGLGPAVRFLSYFMPLSLRSRGTALLTAHRRSNPVSRCWDNLRTEVPVPVTTPAPTRMGWG